MSDPSFSAGGTSPATALPNPRRLSSPELKLLAVALIWGFDFVAQRQGVLGSGPFFFNAASFGLGALVLGVRRILSPSSLPSAPARRAGILTGLVLFGAISFQSAGLAHTGAGKAAFITCLYIVLVPVAMRVSGVRGGHGTWIGCALSVLGLWFLCVQPGFALAPSDLLVLACSVFWAAHILLVGRFASAVDQNALSFWQFVTCATLSLGCSVGTESIGIGQVWDSLLPILYNGVLSAGIAYSLQISGQGGTSSSRAALILSMETVFAAIGGCLFLNERFGPREALGSLLMLAGVLSSRLGAPVREKESNSDRMASLPESGHH